MNKHWLRRLGWKRTDEKKNNVFTDVYDVIK